MGEALDLPHGDRPTFLPLGPLAVEEGGVDPALQLVLVGGVDQVGEAVHALPGRGQPLAGLCGDVAARVAQGLAEELAQVLGQLERAHDLGEQLVQSRLADERLLRAALGAVVVDVPLLLDLGGDGGSAVPAGEQAGVGELALVAPGVGVAVEAVLHPLPQLPGHDDGVAPPVEAARPVELARVDRVPQDVVDGAGLDLAASLAAQAVVQRPARQILHRVGARVVEHEQLAHEVGALGVQGDAAAPVHAPVDVAEGRGARPVAFLGLLPHALLDFFGEVVHVVLRHEHLDAVDELFGRAGVVGEDDALLDQVDLEALHLVEGHPVLEVAVQPVGFFHQDHGQAGAPLAQEGHHAVEGQPPGGLGGLHVYELLHDVEAVVLGVAGEQGALGGDGEALSLLLP